MSRRLPRVTAAQILRVLHQRGFEEVRASGSHRILRNAAGTRVTVPYHTGQILHPKLLLLPGAVLRFGAQPVPQPRSNWD
jgi:predicted RNA binding protein YcfA (HicA-like mRNA interferase family)